MYLKLFEIFERNSDLHTKQNYTLMPSIPFLPLFLKEMILVDEADFLKNESKNSQNQNLIFFEKVKNKTKIIKKIDFFKEMRYNFKIIPEIFNYL